MIEEHPQKPLQGLRCMICGVPDSRLIEELVCAMGGKPISMDKASHPAPDVVVSDRAWAKRLQVNVQTKHLSWW